MKGILNYTSPQKFIPSAHMQSAIYGSLGSMCVCLCCNKLAATSFIHNLFLQIILLVFM